ncbi:NAD(P)-binding protein [Penicillium cosmopolitanum]|uniref:NAD(P)-binding protein n=1 Tax=Penicillium cosmopolitanum TaxID=1131564 RepID=A0A9W9VE82_9EURO|nr:NAD(P)-binding protein [Penicillium cosmopolitanum]KAJ5378893.1 NAD(P)-binding protein [Penicillium cosmopolitanum]
MSTSRVINVAVIGAGEIAMCTHLPTLGFLSHMYEVTAIVDVSKQALEHCARKFNIPRTFTDVSEMLAACSDVDVVLICHSDEFHSVHAVQCLKAGKHLFIEKPMAQTLREADDIETARLASGKLVFVGYMRRYATAFLRFKEAVGKLDPAQINYVRFRNFTSRVSQGWDYLTERHLLTTFLGQVSPNAPTCMIVRSLNADIPEEASAKRRQVATSQFEEYTGLDYKSPVAQYIRACKFHISPHDLSLMRELFGLPRHVIAAVPSARGELFVHYAAVSGEDAVLSVDATVEVLAQHQRLKLTFDSPYIKGLPITATTLSRHPNGDFSEETIRPTYEDYYTLMFKELHRCLSGDAEIKTTVLDSREEISMLSDILKVLAEGFEKSQEISRDR